MVTSTAMFFDFDYSIDWSMYLEGAKFPAVFLIIEVSFLEVALITTLDLATLELLFPWLYGPVIGEPELKTEYFLSELIIILLEDPREDFICIGCLEACIFIIACPCL
jgi:hypothetical protein